MNDLHASLTPNIINAGETLTVEFDSKEKWKSAEKVIVYIFEVDAASPIEPSPGKKKLVVTFYGKLDDNKFTLTPRSGNRPNPKVPKVTGNPPKFKIELGGVTTEVPLPDTNHENGVFELRLQVKIIKPQKKKFTSKYTVYVRSFEHFQVNKQKLPVITFIATTRSDSYFKAAQKFWKLNADAVVARNGMSMEEVLEVLDKESEKYGEWGQINIVTHGTAKDIKMKILKDSDKASMHVDKINSELERRPLESPSGIDSDTQIVFRACRAGGEQELVETIHGEFFSYQGTLYIPKFIQYYHYKSKGKQVNANEWFEESLTFDTPSIKEPKDDDLANGLENAFNNLQSPGAGGDSEKEIPTFDKKHDWVQKLFIKSKYLEEKIKRPDGKPMDESELVSKIRAEWRQHNLHESTEGWKTDQDRWHIKVKSKKIDSQRPQSEIGWWFEITKGTGSPKFQQFIGGAVSIGKLQSGNIWVITAEDVADIHTHLEMDQSAPNMIKVEDADSGTPTFVIDAKGKKHKLENGSWAIVPIPARVKMGKATVRVRRGKAFIVRYLCRRYWVDRRRILRKFEPTKDHDKRDLIIPTLSDPQHYGSSSL